MRKLIISLLFALAVSGSALGQSQHLKGLTGVSVRVDILDAEQRPISLPELKSDVEVELRKAGIKVHDDSVADGLSNVGRLYVGVGTLRLSNNMYICHASVSLQERVRLERKPEVRIVGQTWSHSRMMTASAENDFRRVRDEVFEMIKTFTRNFLEANPR